MSAVCACCGRSIAADFFHVDEERRVIVRQGKSVELTRQQFDVFRALAERPGALVASDDLYAILGKPREAHDDNHLKVVISKIRSQLDEIAIYIVCTWDAGYHIEFGDPADLEDRRRGRRNAGARPSTIAHYGQESIVAEMRGRGVPLMDIARETGLTYRALGTLLTTLNERQARSAA